MQCGSYNIESVRSAVHDALRLAELDGHFASDRSVLLKPNMLSTRRPEEAVTTHPTIVRVLGETALEHGCTVELGDSPPFAGEKPERYRRLCRVTGMSAVAGDLGIPLVRFEEDVVEVQNPDGRFYRSFGLARAGVEADLVVNIPKLKTHGLTTFSGAIKNVFGCVPGIRKGLFHVQAAEEREVFAQMLVDLLGAVRPTVHVMDAVIAMEGEGPNAGKPRQLGLILASSDPVALDAVACRIVGIEPFSIDTTRLAHEHGLGCGDPNQIEVRGEAIEYVRVSDFRLSSGRNDWSRIPSPIRRLLRRQLVASPQIDSHECTGCGDCVSACPAKAISPGRPPDIDLAKCIRCYCCHEVCNFSAATLKRGFLGELFFRAAQKR